MIAYIRGLCHPPHPAGMVYYNWNQSPMGKDQPFVQDLHKQAYCENAGMYISIWDGGISQWVEHYGIVG